MKTIISLQKQYVKYTAIQYMLSTSNILLIFSNEHVKSIFKYLVKILVSSSPENIKETLYIH